MVNLGVMALEEERWADAAEFLEKAGAAGPSDPGTWYLLARARLELGEMAAASAAIERALALAPRERAFVELRERIPAAGR